jgi:hypothetical protein
VSACVAVHVLFAVCVQHVRDAHTNNAQLFDLEAVEATDLALRAGDRIKLIVRVLFVCFCDRVLWRVMFVHARWCVRV